MANLLPQVSTSNVEHLEATCRALCEASSLHGGGHAAWPRPTRGREGGKEDTHQADTLAPRSLLRHEWVTFRQADTHPAAQVVPSSSSPAHSHSLPRLHYHCLASLVSGKESAESQSGPRSHPRLSCHASSVFITLGLDYRGSWRNI